MESRWRRCHASWTKNSVSGVVPRLLAVVEALTALEGVPMRMTVYEADISGAPRPAAELADLRWVSGTEDGVELAPAVRNQVLPGFQSHSGFSSVMWGRGPRRLPNIGTLWPLWELPSGDV